MNKNALTECIALINTIEQDIILYEKEGIICESFKEIIDEPQKIDFLIDEINKYLLPRLYYAREILNKGKTINKNKINYGDYIIKCWPHEASLGLDLMELLKLLQGNTRKESNTDLIKVEKI